MTEKGLQKAKAIVDMLSEKKGEDILLLDLIGECSFSDYFVICTGPSARTLRALSEEVQKRMKKQFDGALGSAEGEAESGWILLDYGDVIVHLFSEPVRRYYGLENLWGDGQVVVHLK
ncbi:MAG: ribosome silencing factor [Anaerolineales bacterium]